MGAVPRLEGGTVVGGERPWRPPPGFRWWQDPAGPSRRLWRVRWPVAGGSSWELTLADCGGWYLAGRDDDGTVTSQLSVGSRVTMAKQLACRWITEPEARDQMLAAGLVAVTGGQS